MNFEKTLEMSKTPEIMPMPEIKTEVNQGYFWYTFLQKAVNPDWEQFNNEHQFSKELQVYFEKTPIDSGITQKWNNIVSKIDNYETLFWFSLACYNPELESGVLEDCEKCKNLDQEKTKHLFNEFQAVLIEFREKNPGVWNLLEPYLNEDLEKRKNFDEERSIVQDAINYFRPYKKTSDIQEVNYLPTNFLIKETKGSGFCTKNTGIVLSHFKNLSSKRHEFLHFIINPITEKVDLTKEQEEKIFQMASENLVVEQKYGEHPQSLLNENLIRVYCALKENRKPISFKEFERYINDMSEQEYEKIKIDNLEEFEKIGIHTFQDLKDKIQEVYANKVRNILGEKIYNLYLDFENKKKDNPNLTFEDYFLENYTLIF